MRTFQDGVLKAYDEVDGGGGEAKETHGGEMKMLRKQYQERCTQDGVSKYY